MISRLYLFTLFLPFVICCSLHADDLADCVAKAESVINQRYAFAEYARSLAMKRLKEIAEGAGTDEEKCRQIEARFISLSNPLNPVKVEDESIKNLMELTRGGSPDACYRLGKCYQVGDRIAKDSVLAFKCFEASAKAGYPPAMVELARCYESGSGVEQNAGKAARWYRQAGERGDFNGQFMTAQFYSKQKDFGEAFKWYSMAAQQGLAAAQFALGLCYYQGEGVQRNYNEAALWFGIAAAKDNADAQNYLGMCYLSGKGVPMNPVEAFRLFYRAAKQGHAAAAFNLGSCYENGQGVEIHRDYARQCYEYAAIRGDRFAEEALKRLGGGTKKSAASQPSSPPIAK